MALVVGAIIVLAALSLAFELSRGKSAKRKYMVWGITTMLPIAFVFSWLVALIYGDWIAHDGFAAIGLMMLLIPLFFLTGVILLLVGLFTKEKLS
ncbi:hypothetical protein [Paenibacillus cellulositrophicus]|uniref:hypothetical protein n=1 Tax=Paenibacillus cellulositrophicus TaxID=562959 RepID=UPI00126701E2|nr:hypothetical protein [Paenibacillus cellulositrophicus]